MKVNLLKDWQALEGISEQWNPLLESSAQPRLFLRWEWVDAWRRATGQKHPPWVLTVTDDQDQLRGLLPFWQAKMRLAGVLPVRALRFLGDTNNAFEYPLPIVARGFEAEVIERLADALVAESARWDMVWLPNVKDGDLALWQRFRSRDIGFKQRPAAFARFDLPATWPEYEKQLSANARQRNRRLLRQFENLGGAFEVCESQDAIPEYLSRLFQLHTERWRQQGLTGSFAERPSVVRFYETFVPVAFERGWLFMTGYRLQGQLKAVQFGFREGGSYLQIQEGFDPNLPSGVGNALRYFSLKCYIEQGIRHFDFLGGYTEHKQRWGGERVEGADVMLVANRHWLKASLLRQVWPTGRWINDLSRSQLDQS